MANSTELEELQAVRIMIESEVFQRYFVKTLRDKENKTKADFFSDTLHESWKKGGYIEGIEEFFKILKIVDRDFKNKQFDDTGN